MKRSLLLSLLALGLLVTLPACDVGDEETEGCSNPNFLTQEACEGAGHQWQEGGSTATTIDSVDILFVIDNSNSMDRIQEELALHFPSFLDPLAESGLDSQIGVTTTDMSASGNGNQGNIRSSSTIGAPDCGPPAIVTPQSANPAGEFINLVDVGVSGAGDEQPVYAAAVAMCKGKDASWWSQLADRPDTDPVKVVCSQVPEAQQACNEGFFRTDAASVVIVVSDEGDDTERLETLPPPEQLSDCVLAHNDDPFFGECDCRMSWWLDFFDGIGQPVVFATIGPTYQFESDDSVLCDGSTVNYPGPCNPFGSTTCSVDFHQEMACQTGGLFTPIEQTGELDDPTTCETSNFDAALGNIGALLLHLSQDDDGSEDPGCAGCQASLAEASGPAGLVLVGLPLMGLAVLRRRGAGLSPS